jgi:hypothetical protein
MRRIVVQRASASAAVRWAGWSALLVSSLALGGCVQATIDGLLLPDGSGKIAVDVAYDTRAWLPIFGDPLSSYESREALELYLTPGLRAWAPPERSEEGPWRHLRVTAFFDDIDQLRFFGSEDDQPFETLGFSYDRPRRRILLRTGFERWLDDPLPLPQPRDVGMNVSLPESFIEMARERIGAFLNGVDLQLRLTFPGEVERADVLDRRHGRQAILRVGQERLTQAFQQRAGVLVDERSLSTDPPAQWQWKRPSVSDEEIEEFRREFARARAWWDQGR